MSAQKTTTLVIDGGESTHRIYITPTVHPLAGVLSAMFPNIINGSWPSRVNPHNSLSLPWARFARLFPSVWRLPLFTIWPRKVWRDELELPGPVLVPADAAEVTDAADELGGALA